MLSINGNCSSFYRNVVLKCYDYQYSILLGPDNNFGGLHLVQKRSRSLWIFVETNLYIYNYTKNVYDVDTKFKQNLQNRFPDIKNHQEGGRSLKKIGGRNNTTQTRFLESYDS